MHLEPNDPIIDEIREVRHRISERVGHDPARLVAYYIELQKQSQGRLVDAPGPKGAEVVSETELSVTDGCGGPVERGIEAGR